MAEKVLIVVYVWITYRAVTQVIDNIVWNVDEFSISSHYQYETSQRLNHKTITTVVNYIHLRYKWNTTGKAED